MKKLHIGDLYDYVIGTQTGAMTAAMLSLTEDNKPRYFSSGVKDFMVYHSQDLFTVSEVTSLKFFSFCLISSILFTIIFSLIAYLRNYDSKKGVELTAMLENLHKIRSEPKGQAKSELEDEVRN